MTPSHISSGTSGKKGIRHSDAAKAQEQIFLERHKKLNTAQRKAVETTDGPLLVVAGPGSGKTEILSMRVAQILRNTQALPSNILCLTFTDSAALNMRDRLARLIGDRAYQVVIHTFHNFCVDIIRKHGEFFYHNATFSPADPVTQISLLEHIFNTMEHDNPLKAYHPEMGYSFLKSTQTSIANVKRSGLRPFELRLILADNVKAFDHIEQVFGPIFDKRMSASVVEEIRSALASFVTDSSKRTKSADLSELFAIFHPIEESFALSLTEALAKADTEEKNEAISDWKKKWFVKDDAGNRVFRDRLKIAQMKSFADVYEMYQAELFCRGYFDFDDMILDVISALEREPRLRYELQEQFQYVLVDEFQDTNNAQMRILTLLTSAPEHGGRPNIMVVGDDDQAIYKFQGAELSNILDFRHRYTDVELVTMTENYRSTQDILNVAMTIIRRGEKRLENLIPDLSKELVARGHDKDVVSVIDAKQLETSLHEFKYVADTIKSLLDQGVLADDIAVIARTHGSLEELVPFMKLAGVPIKYEREQSVFAEPHIQQLITMVRYVASAVTSADHELVADTLLPEILSYPFWNIPRVDIWKISLAAQREKKTWLEIMLEYPNKQIVAIAEFFISLAVESKSTPLELILDKLVGAHIELAVDTPDDDGVEKDVVDVAAQPVATTMHSDAKGVFVSPFRDFYFSEERFAHARAEYLTFLSSLRVFINALRGFNGFDSIDDSQSISAGAALFAGDSGAQVAEGADEKKPVSSVTGSADAHILNSRFRTLKVGDLVRFVDVYEQNGLKLNDESPFVTARSAVQLMSAHKSKGLEFKVVFVLSCQDDEWASRGMPNKLSFPINLPIQPAGDSEDDQLRLFYVALTRAREHLYLTSHEVKDNGKPASKLRFLVGALPDAPMPAKGTTDVQEPTSVHVHELLETASVSYRNAPFLDTEEALLSSVLEGYKLSVTHLNNYLNIPKGGPRLFFEQNLLKFPQSKTVSGSYGSAIHATLEFVLNEFKSKKIFPQMETILGTFETFLRKEKMHPLDFRIYLKKGKDALSAYIVNRQEKFSHSDIPELDFGREHIMVCDEEILDDEGQPFKAFITGKIDKVVLGEDGLEVFDYKTGRAFDSFEDADAGSALKVHQYKNQLIFYKLLIESSAFEQRKLYSVDGEPISLQGRKVISGTIDFVEPVGMEGKKRIQSVATELTQDDMERMRKLAAVVYKRIKNLQFDIPEEISSKTFKNDLESVLAFEEYLLEGNEA